jgi:hypothetical protein
MQTDNPNTTIDITFFRPRGLFKKAVGTHIGDDGKPRTTIF